jgi:hypothetical protein
MDFPIFHLDFLGNRMLIAGIAVLHTMINHPLAVGGMLLITMMEWWGYRKADPEWDRVAKRTLFVFFPHYYFYRCIDRSWHLAFCFLGESDCYFEFDSSFLLGLVY